MKKYKVLSVILVAALVVAAVFVFNPFKPTQIVQAEQYRKGFSLVPDKYDSSGVKADSTFILKTSGIVELAYLTENLSIDGLGKPAIVQDEEKTFTVAVASPFEKNKLYTFRLLATDGEEVTWTFQTSMDFAVLGSFPENTGTNVPVDTGIEIYFTHAEFGNVSSYLEISPAVEGSFENHGHAAVFVPKNALESGTLYTVTVKAGLPLGGSVQALQNDYTFRFETASDYEYSDDYKGSFYYTNVMNEFAVGENPILPFGFYLNKQNTGSINISTSVYAYKDADSFIEAITSSNSVPYWAYYSWSDNMFDYSGLDKVAGFTQDVPVDYRNEQYMNVPVLEAGYYLVDSTWENVHFQTLIQVTNLATYVSDSNTKTLLWINDLKTGAPVANATVENTKTHANFQTNENGVAMFDTYKQDSTDDGYSQGYYFKITAPDGSDAVVPCYSYRLYGYSDYGYYTDSQYWRYFQTDRNLYLPDDKVEFWGFLRNRFSDETIGELTVEISQGYGYMYKASFMSFYMPYIQKPLVSIKVNAEAGFFEGGFELPNLDAGGYQVTVKNGGKIVSSYYITVQKYTKPSYTMSVEKDKEAIFEGETVNFIINTNFFEGTPVANLDIRYSLSGITNFEGQNIKTDDQGQAVISYIPVSPGNMQGEAELYLNSSAILPESGEIYGNSYVRVFINDVQVYFETEIIDGTTVITATLNEIVLDRLNSGSTEDYYDYLGSPVSGRTLNGQIIKHTRVRIEDGQYYDYINKVVVKTYRYDEVTSVVGSFDMTSDENGIASYSAVLPEITDTWYTAQINCLDNDGKTMNFDVYIYNNLNMESYDYNYEYYSLTGDEGNYRLGDEVKLTFKKNDEPLASGSFLFIESQNGINGYTLPGSSSYTGVYEENEIPNYYVTGVYFNGKTYIDEYCNAVYDYNEKAIEIHAETDKPGYKPGEECTIKITAVDINGKPVAARVNLAIIDEALLKLSDQYVDVLQSLYSWVNSGITYTYSSHYNANGNARTAGTAADGLVEELGGDSESSGPVKQSAGAAATDMALNETYIRQEFKDTAYFKTITLDENGEGTITFKLPDNVTAWRVTMAGISEGLYGGTGTAQLNVSLPFFINYSMNNVYLTGDEPCIGVTAYGEALEKGDKITFQITSPQQPDLNTMIEGYAFERVNLPLWKLEEGSYEIVVKALSSDGDTDGFRQTINVVSTFHEIETADYGKLEAGMSIQAGTGGLTTIIFTDDSRGKFLPALYSLAYSGGNRIDQKYVALLAKNLISKYFSDLELWGEIPEVAVSDYINTDGGIGILPYAASDLRTTALLTSLVKDEVAQDKLMQYFYGFVLDTETNASPAALYGLAVLGEPVLLELDKAAAIENLGTEDYIFLALAYAQLGETPRANEIFVNRLVPLLDEKDPYSSIKVENDTDLTLQYTALTSVLMSKLGRDQKDGMFAYISDKWSKNTITNIEKMLYIQNEIEGASDVKVNFRYTYDGNTYNETLEGGSTVRINVPSQKMSDLTIDSVTGSACVVSIYNEKLTGSVAVDGDLSVSREYYNYTTGQRTTAFEQSDIVKVVINWSIGKDAVDSGYELTDYVPAGLQAIDSPWQAGIKPEDGYWSYRNIDGQKVTFYVNKEYSDKEPFVYYARVINQGEFTAESPIIQGTIVRDSLNFGTQDIITIK